MERDGLLANLAARFHQRVVQRVHLVHLAQRIFERGHVQDPGVGAARPEA